MKKFILSILPLFFITACTEDNTVDGKQAQATERMLGEAQRQVGMPAITNFTERKFAKMILELRDKEMTTYTYYTDMHGKKHFLCESVGYGIPYSTQFTNPERIAANGANGKFGTLPQPDPNGLFMPTSSSATWVLAMKAGKVKPIYVEQTIIVSPFKLDTAG